MGSTRGSDGGLDADVIVVGAGPVGLLLACELRLAGVRTVVLERRTEIGDTPKAGGLSGQIIDLLHHRGELGRFEAAGMAAVRPPQLPWGGMHVDLTPLAENPMQVLPLPQPQLERVLDALAHERGAEVRRGHHVVGLRQDDASVTAEVQGPDGGTAHVKARYLVGCDGARSPVRELAGIPFPGLTYPEVQRLAAFTVPEGVTILDNGDIEVDGVGRIPFGFTTTERGEFALGAGDPTVLGLFTTEEDTADYDDDEPMTADEMRASVHRVLGVDIPVGEPTRLTRFTFHARHVERYREGRVFVAGDAAHLFPSPGAALNAGLLDSVNLAWKLAAAVEGWAPDGLLDTYHDERHLAGERTLLHTHAQVAIRRGHDPAAEALRDLLRELLADEQPLQRLAGFMAGSELRYPWSGQEDHPLVGTFAPALAGDEALLPDARPLLLDLADRADLRAVGEEWRARVDVRTLGAVTAARPADALLIRPDAHVAWVGAVDEPTETAAPAMREALTRWFGAP